MAKRSINAQVEEISRILEEKRNQARSMRGSDLSRAEEHLLRLESALATLQWVRDHADVIRQLASVGTGKKRSDAMPGTATKSPDKAAMQDQSRSDKDRTS